MSEGRKMPWDEAAAIAQELAAELAPVVARVKTVGSVRRRRPEVGDIELLAEPVMYGAGLFGEQAPDLASIRDVASRWGRLVKNGDRFIQVGRPGGSKVDLFLCYPPAQWGSLLAIRTGPFELSRWAVTCIRDRGMEHKQGRVIDAAGNVLPTPGELEFFALAGLRCLPPRVRHLPEAFQTVGGRRP